MVHEILFQLSQYEGATVTNQSKIYITVLFCEQNLVKNIHEYDLSETKN
jgi:hypothetical protein